jgi:hypothetical protein
MLPVVSYMTQLTVPVWARSVSITCTSIVVMYHVIGDGALLLCNIRKQTTPACHVHVDGIL